MVDLLQSLVPEEDAVFGAAIAIQVGKFMDDAEFQSQDNSLRITVRLRRQSCCGGRQTASYDLPKKPLHLVHLTKMIAFQHALLTAAS